MEARQALRVLMVLALVSLLFGWLLDVGFLYGLSAAFLVVGLVSTRLTRAIASGWMKLASWIGDFNSRLLLGLIFYLVLTPVAFLYRRFAGEPLRLHPSDVDTYFHDADPPTSPEDFENPW